MLVMKVPNFEKFTIDVLVSMFVKLLGIAIKRAGTQE
jgi:hypothetical protein